MAAKGKLLSRGIILTFDVLTSVLTVVLAGVLFIATVSTHVNPNTSIWFAFLGLAYPFIYIANLLVMLYWILRWKKVAFVSMAVMLIGLGSIGKYFKPSLSKSYESVKPKEAVRVMSYNVGGFWNHTKSGSRSTMEEIKAYIIETDPDIICMQEFEVSRRHSLAEFEQGLEKWKHSQHSFVKSSSAYGWGLAVYSKYPLTNKEILIFPESSNSAMWVDVVIRRDTIRLYNNHLQTTQVDEHDREFLGNDVFADVHSKDKAKGIARKLRRNFKVRADQADSVSLYIHNEEQPRIVVCGDFNDTPMSYTYQKIKGNLNDAFKKQGRGFVSTYKGLGGMFRIDFILHSDNMQTMGYQVDELPWSDHNPVVVDLKLKHK